MIGSRKKAPELLAGCDEFSYQKQLVYCFVQPLSPLFFLTPSLEIWLSRLSNEQDKTTILFCKSIRRYLIVDGPSIVAIGTLVEYRLTFVHRSQLHRVVSNFRRITFHAGFLDRRARGLLRFLQSCLFGVALGPQGRRPTGRVGDFGRYFTHLGQIVTIRTDFTENFTCCVDF